MERVELKEDGAACWLRPCDEADAAAIHAAAVESMERVGRWMPWLTPDYSLEDSRKWAGSAAADWEAGSRYEFVMVDAESGRVCGCCGLNGISHENLLCNLGYWVCDSAVRRGMATAATRMLGDFGLGALGLKRIEIVVATGNVASRGVAEKVGAIHEGIQRLRLRVGGVSHDAHMYVLLAESP